MIDPRELQGRVHSSLNDDNVIIAVTELQEEVRALRQMLSPEQMKAQVAESEGEFMQLKPGVRQLANGRFMLDGKLISRANAFEV